MLSAVLVGAKTRVLTELGHSNSHGQLFKLKKGEMEEKK